MMFSVGEVAKDENVKASIKSKFHSFASAIEFASMHLARLILAVEILLIFSFKAHELHKPGI